MIIQIIETKCKCDVCQWEWMPRSAGLPTLCPNVRCHSYRWNDSGKIHDLTKVDDGTVDDFKDIENFEKNYNCTVNKLYRNGK